MKTTKNTTRKNKFLRFGAGALILSILFVFVFAGVLSASFAVVEKAIENGLLEANVADADCFHDDEWTGVGSSTTTTLPNIYTSHTASLTLTNSNWTTVEANQDDKLDSYSNTTGNMGGIYAEVKNNWGKHDGAFTRRTIIDLSNISNITSVSVSVTLYSRMDRQDGTIKSRTRVSVGNSQQFTCSTDTDNKNNTAFGTERTLSSGSTGNWRETLNSTVQASSIQNNKVYINFGINCWSDGRIGRLTSGKTSKYYCNVTDISLTVNTTSSSITLTKNPSSVGSINSSSLTFADTSTTQTATAGYVDNDKYYFKNWTQGNATKTEDKSFDILGYQYPTGTEFVANFDLIQYSFNGDPCTTTVDKTLKIVVDIAENCDFVTCDNTLPTGFSSTITYKNSSGNEISSISAKGNYSAIITIKKGDDIRGTRIIEFAVTEGDFGKKTYGVSGNWGTQNNPYMIRTNEHLTNLINIMNGSQAPQNSVKGVSGIASNAAIQGTYTTVSGTKVYNYENCWFEVEATETLTASSPIAINSTWAFKGTFDGGNFTITVSLTHSFN